MSLVPHLAKESISLSSTELWWNCDRSSPMCKLASFTSLMISSVLISRDALTWSATLSVIPWVAAPVETTLKEKQAVAQETATEGSLWYWMVLKTLEITKTTKELILNNLLIGSPGKYYTKINRYFRSFPDRFRVIILTRKRSKAMNHFKLRKCPLLYMGDQIHFCNLEIK